MTSQETVSVTHVVRPRRNGWGDSTARRAMSEIAENLRRLGGYGVCGIEVLRSDAMLEFVAVATDNPVTRTEHEGDSSPLSAMYPALDQGVEVGVLTFVRAEDLTREAFERLLPYSVLPDVPPSDDPARWRAEDMLVAHLRDDQGKLRGLVYLDLPHDGMRPTTAQLADLEKAIRPLLHGALVQIEREEYAPRIRLTSGVRAAIRSSSPHADVRELLRTIRMQCREAFRAKALWITVGAGDGVDGGPDSEVDGEAVRPLGAEVGPEARAATRSALVDAWERQAVLIIDPNHVWGDDELNKQFRGELTPQVSARGLGEIVLVPVGAGPDFLGVLTVDRDPDAPRWTDDESSAALDVAHDLGRAILNARANERERAAVAELRHLDAYRRTLIDSMARELQNPLALVAGHLELLHAMELPDEVQRSLVPMIRNTARLTNLARDLALLSRLADSSTPVGTATLDLAQLATEAVAAVTSQAEHRQVTISLAITGSSPVQGHPLELSRCIGNLLDNAVKFSTRGGHVEVEVGDEDDGVTLTVRDQGIGISSTDHGALFGAFYRSADPAALGRPGYGLGLSIVRQVAIRHGGTVAVESSRGEGATFRVVLPRADPATLSTTW
jgi:two-component system phosphate regulon sensor histidine kinase PhoR